MIITTEIRVEEYGKTESRTVGYISSVRSLMVGVPYLLRCPGIGIHSGFFFVVFFFFFFFGVFSFPRNHSQEMHWT
jgi:hypothetical protein